MYVCMLPERVVFPWCFKTVLDDFPMDMSSVVRTKFRTDCQTGILLGSQEVCS